MWKLTAVVLFAFCAVAHSQIGCVPPYTHVGDRCIYVAPFLHADWDEARFFCSEVKGNLVKVDDIHLFMDLIAYLKENSLDSRSYWIDGTDRIVDGVWTWTNGEEIPMGAPYWAVSGTEDGDYITEPSDNGKDNHDCVALDGGRALYFDDADCSLTIATICEPHTGG